MDFPLLKLFFFFLSFHVKGSFRGAVFVLDHAFFVVQFHKQYVVDFGTFSVFFAGGFLRFRSFLICFLTFVFLLHFTTSLMMQLKTIAHPWWFGMVRFGTGFVMISCPQLTYELEDKTLELFIRGFRSFIAAVVVPSLLPLRFQKWSNW